MVIKVFYSNCKKFPFDFMFLKKLFDWKPVFARQEETTAVALDVLLKFAKSSSKRILTNETQRWKYFT